MIAAPVYSLTQTSSEDKSTVPVHNKVRPQAKGGLLIETPISLESTEKSAGPETEQAGQQQEKGQFSGLEDQTADFVVPSFRGTLGRVNRFPSESRVIERQQKAFNQSLRSINESVRQMNSSIQRIRTPRGY